MLPGFGNILLIMHANAAQNWAASLVFLYPPGKKSPSPDNWSRIEEPTAQKNQPIGAAEIAKTFGLTKPTVDYHIRRHMKVLAKSGAGAITKWSIRKNSKSLV